jgi:hypothetical protein
MSHELLVIDVSDPKDPRQVGFYFTMGQLRGVFASNGYIYVTDSANGLCILKHSEWAVQPHSKLVTTWGEVRRNQLLQNYPNPFNPETWIPFQLSEGSEVEVKIYDSTGRLIRTLDLGFRGPGSYASREDSARWDGRNQCGEKVVSGVYFYTICAGKYTATRKMVLAD